MRRERERGSERVSEGKREGLTQREKDRSQEGVTRKGFVTLP